MFIQVLNENLGDHYDAERFARINYEILTSPHHGSDLESYEVANAARNLSLASCNLIKANGPNSADIEEAEMLARKAVRIIKNLKGPISSEIIWAISSLLSVVILKKDFTD
jgi:hypothetical protein